MEIPYIYKQHVDSYKDNQLNIATISTPETKTIKNIIIKDSQTLENWFFTGTKGVGKTTNAFIIYKLRKQFLEQNISDKSFIDKNSRYIKAEDYTELCQKAISIPSCYQEIDIIKNIQFLILDEIRASEKTITVINQLTRLIEHRRDRGLQTIFTSNGSPKAMIGLYEDLGNAIIAMSGINNLLLCTGSNNHIQKESQKPKIYNQICL